jgi:hypothetical protein
MNLKKAALLLAATALCTTSFATTLPKLGVATLAPSEAAIAGVYPTTSEVTSLGVTITPSAGATSCFYTLGTTATTPTTTASPTNIACATATPFTVVAISPASTAVAQTLEVLSSKSGYTANITTGKYLVLPQLATPSLTPNSSISAPFSVTVEDSGVSVAGTIVHPTVLYSLGATSDPAVAKTGSTTYNAKTGAYTPVQVSGTVNFRASLSGFADSSIIVGHYGDIPTASTFVGVGSSAQAFEYALAFSGIKGDGVGGACGSHHFTYKNGASAIDTRSGVTPADGPNNLTIAWDNSADETALLADGNVYATYTAPTKVCVYLSLDSTLGVKAFMNSNLTNGTVANPAEYLNIIHSKSTNYSLGTPDSSMNEISPFWFYCGTSGCTASNTTTLAEGANPDELEIPSDVLAIAQGAPFNAGVTDIRPEDAYFATTRALAKITATRTGLGYGPSPLGAAILETPSGWNSNATSTNFNVVDFALVPNAKDPINGKLKQQAYQTISIGAAPVVVLINKTNTASDGNYHFSDSTIQNISRFTLAGYLNGSITGTKYLNPSATSTLGSAPVHVFLREPLSGTYNTMEMNIPRSSEIGSSQEAGVNPAYTVADPDCAGNTGNPLNITVNASTSCYLGTLKGTAPNAMVGVLGATRQRAIGTGDMVKAVSFGANDSLGYTFWGYGNIKSGNGSAPTQDRYLTVDGVDPILSSYGSLSGLAAGTVPTCTAASYTGTCPFTLTFPNVANGSYPIWSIYRAVVPAGVSSTATGTNGLIYSVIQAAITASSTAADFVPVNEMQAFHSHYTQAGVAPSNGFSTAAEAGGDAGGAVYTIQADLQHVADYSTEILNVKQ